MVRQKMFGTRVELCALSVFFPPHPLPFHFFSCSAPLLPVLLPLSSFASFPFPSLSSLSFPFVSLHTPITLTCMVGCMSSLFLLHKLCLQIKILKLNSSAPSTHPVPSGCLPPGSLSQSPGSCLFTEFMNLIVYLGQGFGPDYKSGK